MQFGPCIEIMSSSGFHRFFDKSSIGFVVYISKMLDYVWNLKFKLRSGFKLLLDHSKYVSYRRLIWQLRS
jgi:hypothetical protein